MAKLIHKQKTILNKMDVATSTWKISRGLMFASKKRTKNGICLVMPVKKDVQFGASVTMLFCFHPLEIIFINTKFEVVDKKILKPWRPNYTPKRPCKYVIETWPGYLKDIKLGDKISLLKSK